MLQIKPETPDLWDSILPKELARVDVLLQDDRLMEPFLRRFNQTQGRPGVPISTHLRLMYLKFRYKLGHETLVVRPMAGEGARCVSSLTIVARRWPVFNHFFRRHQLTVVTISLWA